MSRPDDPTLEQLLLHNTWVRTLAASLIGDRHLAEDLAQDAAVAVMQSPHPPERPTAWLRGTMRNLAAGLRRRTTRRDATERSVIPQTTAPSAADSAALVEQQRILAEAILALEAPYREVILLRFYDGLPQREIAGRLSAPVATVNSRLTRALAKLRARLDAQHGGDRQAWVRALAPLALRAGEATAVAGLDKGSLVAVSVVFATLLTGVWIVVDRDPGKPPAQVVAEHVPEEDGLAANSDREAPGPGESRSPPREPVPVDLLEIQIVDAQTREPAPDVEVFAVDPSHRESRQFERYYHDLALRRASLEDVYRLGVRIPVDEGGSIEIERPQTVVRLMAWDGDRIGMLSVSSDADESSVATLEVWPRHDVRVRVVDETGAPLAGVPVGVQPGGMQRDTNAEGYADLHWSTAYDPNRSPTPHAFLAIPGADLHLLPEPTGGMHEITLTCPPSGTVRVSVTIGGRPAPEGTLVYLVPPGTRDGKFRPEYGNRYRQPFVAETRDAFAEFWPVIAGEDVEAYVLPWGAVRAFAVRGPGPATAHRVATLALDADAHSVPIRGRVLTDEPSPESASATISVDGDQFHVSLDLDEHGSFVGRFPFQRESADFGRIEVYARGRGRVELPLPPPGEDRAIELGDLQLESALVGRVVDPSGQPITSGSIALVEPSKMISTGWWPLGGRSAVLDAEGRFALQDELPEGEPWLQVQGLPEGLHHEPVPLPPGARDVRLVVRPAGDVAGQLLLDDAAFRNRLDVMLWAEGSQDGPWPRAPYLMSNADTDGRIRFRSLAPGRYTLAVYISGEHFRSIARVDGITASAGELIEDPRLNPLDLRGAFRAIDLRVSDEQGAAVRGHAIIHVEGPPRERNSWQFASLETPIIIPTEAVVRHIVIRADGCFPVTLRDVDGTHEVVLSRGLPVDLRLHGTPELPDDHGLFVRLQPAGSPVRRGFRTFEPDTAAVSSQGHARPHVPEPGSYRVRIGLLEGRDAYEEVNLAGPSEVLVTADTPASFDVALDPAAIQQALERLRQRRR